MADPNYPAAPQAFTFRGRRLVGNLVAWSGNTPRRAVVQEFLKRRGALVEDMERGPRRLEVRLQFLGDSCAQDYQEFETFVHRNPRGLLVHPVAGKWQAFCLGPTQQADFSRAIDAIECRVSFVESDLDAALPISAPDVATQAQEATAQIAALQVAVAGAMAVNAKALVFDPAIIQAINQVADEIQFLPNPVDSMLNVIEVSIGVGSNIVEPIQDMATKTTALVSIATQYVNAATDLFNGEEIEAGQARQTDTLLGNTLTAGEELEESLVSGSATPAGMADAVGSTEETLSACLELAEAVEAARPPVIAFRVPALTDVVTLAQRRYGRNAAARASEILGLNDIENPAAIPAGTVLIIPSR